MKSLSGTSWHVDNLHKNETEPRRHKSRCIYNDNNYCKYYSTKCSGSSHCIPYSTEPRTIDNTDNSFAPRPICHYAKEPEYKKCGLRKNKVCNRHFCYYYIEQGTVNPNARCDHYRGGDCSLKNKDKCDLNAPCKNLLINRMKMF